LPLDELVPISHCGRDLLDLVNFVHEPAERRVGLKILSGEGASINTTTRPAS
jgi:hypothetical protein